MITLIEVSVGKSHYKIPCPQSNKEKLLRLAEKLNQRVNKLAITSRNNDEKSLLLTTALMMEDELEQKMMKNNSEEEALEASELNDQDLRDAVSENMENIANYIDNLTNKVKNY